VETHTDDNKRKNTIVTRSTATSVACDVNPNTYAFVASPELTIARPLPGGSTQPRHDKRCPSATDSMRGSTSPTATTSPRDLPPATVIGGLDRGGLEESGLFILPSDEHKDQEEVTTRIDAPSAPGALRTVDGNELEECRCSSRPRVRVLDHIRWPTVAEVPRH
jgi:hypothetical protein